MHDNLAGFDLDDLRSVGPPPRLPVNVHFHPTDRRYQPTDRGRLRQTMPSQDISVVVQTAQSQVWRDVTGTWQLDDEAEDIVPGFRAKDMS